MNRRRSAFTLIELLVVIAIIAILAAILFPVFAQARDKGRQAACLSNTKQIALAFYMYTQDYDETTPGGCFANFGCAYDENGLKRGTNFTALWPLRLLPGRTHLFLLGVCRERVQALHLRQRAHGLAQRGCQRRLCGRPCQVEQAVSAHLQPVPGGAAVWARAHGQAVQLPDQRL